MEKEKFSYPVSLRRMQITDKFWKNEMELVRTEVIPYQWNALNDKVEGAAPSYCMHNFKVAAEMNRQKRKQGAAYKEPSKALAVPLPEFQVPDNPIPLKSYCRHTGNGFPFL